MGFNLADYSNIPELESYFSLPAMLILITFQPIGEEIFFRGFLLEKIKSIKGEKTAIIFTAFLFGVAHLSFGNLYPAFMTFIIGFLLAFIVIKTKNLFSAITAHILFNVVSFSFYFIGKFI
jgi:membrane protease YdiL (CAAX protease family)